MCTQRYLCRWNTGLRRGVSLLEVMFAIMIVSIGLILVATLIPLAAKQASDSYSLTRGTVFSANARSLSNVQKLHMPNVNPWLVADDVTSGTLVSFDGMMTSTGWGKGNDLSGNPIVDYTTSFCVDPQFWAAQPNAMSGTVQRSDGSEGAYRRARFPYYREDYVPTNDPTTNPGSFTAALARPRMVRVTLGSLQNSALPISTSIAEYLCAAHDELVQKSVSTSTEDTSTKYILDTSSNKMKSSNEFSWFITLTPNERRRSDVITDYYTMAVVVFRNRNRGFLAGKLTTSGETYDATNPPVDERVVNVVSSSATTIGGGGFKVTLEATTAVSDSLRANEWIMLSRLLSNGRSVFRWYQVKSVGESTVDTNTNTWQREAYITGSDWYFDTTAPMYATQATLVSNVVTVVEKMIPINAMN